MKSFNKMQKLTQERLYHIKQEKKKVEQMLQHAKEINQPNETIQTLYGQLFHLIQLQQEQEEILEDIQLDLLLKEKSLSKELKNKKLHTTNDTTTTDTTDTTTDTTTTDTTDTTTTDTTTTETTNDTTTNDTTTTETVKEKAEERAEETD